MESRSRHRPSGGQVSMRASSRGCRGGGRGRPRPALQRDGASVAEQDVSAHASSRARCCSAAEDRSNRALGWRIPPRTRAGRLASSPQVLRPGAGL